jgi:hypothetical protein
MRRDLYASAIRFQASSGMVKGGCKKDREDDSSLCMLCTRTMESVIGQGMRCAVCMEGERDMMAAAAATNTSTTVSVFIY